METGFVMMRVTVMAMKMMKPKRKMVYIQVVELGRGFRSVDIVSLIRTLV